MAIRTYDILLDSYNSTIPEPIVGRQGDKNGAVTLHVTITDRGAAVDLTGQTVNLIAETANGTAVVADNAGVTLTDAVNGKFDYAIPNALWSEAGKIKKAYFSLNDTDGQQTTYDLIFIVKKAIDISQDKADDYITVIDGTIRSLKEKIHDMNTDVQTVLNAYNQGDFYNKSETDSKVQQAVDDLEIGGRNYIENSQPTNDSGWNFSSGGTNDHKVVDGQYIEITRTGGSWHQINRQYQNDKDGWYSEIKPGDRFAISMDISMPTIPTLDSNFYGLLRLNAGNTFSSTHTNWNLKDIIKKANTWYRVSGVTDIPDNWETDFTKATIARFMIESGTGSDTDVIRIRNIKLEKGNKATDWTPSYVDDKVVFSTVDETNSGEEKEKIVSPQTLNRFNEDKNKTYFSIKSLSDLSSDFQYTASEAFLVFKRTGNMVNFWGRVNISSLYTDHTTYSPLISIPDGFKLSTEFNNMAWNASLSVSKYVLPSNVLTGAFAERRETNFIRFTTTDTGNHYLSGSWYTDDNVPGWYQEENIRLSAHRGNTALAPENTLEAFQSAIDSNFGAVELDPRLSSDGELFIMHDNTVDRTTDGTGEVEDLTAEQIRNLTIDTTNYSQYAGKTLRVPSFDESIKTLAAGNMVVNIDGSKIDLSVETTANAIVSILNKYNMFNRAFLVMSNSTQRDAFISMYPDAVVSWLQTSSGGISNGITKAKTYTHAFLSIPLSIATEDNIETIKESGLYFQIYGVDSTTDLARLRRNHVYLIETNGVS